MGKLRELGGFESWTRVVAAAVAWCGAGDPLVAREALASASDSERTALVQILLALQRLCPKTGYTAKEIIGALYTDGKAPQSPDGYGDLRDALEELATPSGKSCPTPKRLGYALRSLRGRVLVGRVLESVDAVGNNENVMRWRVRSVHETRAPSVATMPEEEHAFAGMV